MVCVEKLRIKNMFMANVNSSAYDEHIVIMHFLSTLTPKIL